jgi:two-component system, chemotaxis family, protein-glutamate methylesterase/glutaminase
MRAFPPFPHSGEESPIPVASLAETLGRLLGGLPETFSAAVLVVQHMAHGFVEGFARWLAASATLCGVPIPRSSGISGLPGG